MDIKLELIFFSGILFGQIIGILFGPKIFQLIRDKIKSHRDCKNKQQRKYDIIIDPFYIDTATGEYFFRSQLISKYGKRGLGKLVANGKFENELCYKKKEIKNGKTQ